MPQRSLDETDLSPNADAAAQLARSLIGPLASFAAMGERLANQPLSSSARSQLQAMLDAARRMNDVISDATETQDSLAPAAVVSTPLRQLIDDVDAHWRTSAGNDADHLLISSNASPDLRLMVDPARLRRLLNSLIEDALRLRAWGVVEMQLTTAAAIDGVICIDGRLNAPGASLSSCNPVAANLCEAIVQQMGGVFTRTQGHGLGVETAFTLKLPQAGLEIAVDDADQEEAGPLPPGTHLLIVDDNATNRIVAAALCDMFGCTSETAEDGVEAVEAVKSRPFDLILMDIKMPRMDGLSATQAIRALPSAAADIPIIALTANADADASASYLAGGMQAVVNKPIKPEQLLATLQWALCRHDDLGLAASAVS